MKPMASLGITLRDQQCCCCCLFLLVVIVASGDIPNIRNRAEPGKPQVHLAGKTVLLPCLAEGDPAPIVEWFKDSVLVQPTWTRFRQTHRGLRIKAVDPEDSGRYICRAVNGFGTAQLSLILRVTDDMFETFPFDKSQHSAKEVDVEVEEDEEREDEDSDDNNNNDDEEEDDDDDESQDDDGVESNFYPEQDSIPSHVSGTKPVLRKVTDMSPDGLVQQPRGSTVVLKCVAEGDPVPQLRWFKDDRELPVSPSKTSRRRWTLMLRNVQPEDSGLYMCLAVNHVGAVNSTFPLQVVDGRPDEMGEHKPEPPAVHPLNTTVHVGGIASFQCRVRSRDTPKIVWLKQDVNGTLDIRGVQYRALKTSEVVMETRNSGVYLNKLVINPATLRDSGTYVCLGTNTRGYNSRSALLVVKPNPQFIRPPNIVTTEPRPTPSRFTLSLTVVLPVAVVLLLATLGIICLMRRRKNAKSTFPKHHLQQHPQQHPQQHQQHHHQQQQLQQQLQQPQLPRQQQQQQPHLQYPYVEPNYTMTWSKQGTSDRVWTGGPPFSSITPPPIPTTHRPTSQGSDRSSHQSRKSSGRHPRQYPQQHVLVVTC